MRNKAEIQADRTILRVWSLTKANNPKLSEADVSKLTALRMDVEDWLVIESIARYKRKTK